LSFLLSFLGAIKEEIAGILGCMRVVRGCVIVLLRLDILVILLLLSLQLAIEDLSHLVYLLEQIDSSTL
jgi:hypothetical protein